MEGKLKHWNEDKGFGFISTTEPQDVFIHISALKKMSRRPKVGDSITFTIHTDNNGKKRAINAKIHGVAELIPDIKHSRKAPKSKGGRGWLLSIIFFILVAVVGYEIYKTYFNQRVEAVISSDSITPIKKVLAIDSSNFRCTGKIYCSEMNSCEEAKFYLKNCPGTKMDGDKDRVPCENQWCN